MEKHRFTIESNRTVAALTHRLVLKADDPDLVRKAGPVFVTDGTGTVR